MRSFLPVALLLASAATAAPVDRPVTLPDGRTLNLWCEGRRGPVVVLDSGWSADSRAWGRVITPLAQDFRVCAQDRAGAGRSDAGPLPRDGAAVARDLAAALQAAKLPGRYILVGHSMGALNMRHFALRHPERVAGMVLVDPSVPHQDARIAAVAGPGAGSTAPLVLRAERCLAAHRAGPLPADEPALERCRVTPPERGAVRWEARWSEIASFSGSTSSGLDRQTAGSLDVPLILLSAFKGRSPGPATAFHLALHSESAAISTQGELRRVPESGHMMMFDAPEAIVQAVRDVAFKARR